MMDGWKKKDPTMIKKLPIEVHIPEFLVKMASGDASEEQKATAYLTGIAVYYLLWAGEYTCKQPHNKSKHVVQFGVKDVTLFKRNKHNPLCQLSRKGLEEEIMAADSCTLKLTNQNNGQSGAYINHYDNRDSVQCPVRAFGRRILHIKVHMYKDDAFLST